MQERAGIVTSESESHEAREQHGGQGPGRDASVSERHVNCCGRRRRWGRCGEQNASRDAGCERLGEGSDTEGGGGRRCCSQERSYNTQTGRE